MAKHAASFDFILDCVAAPHDVNAYIALLKRDGLYAEMWNRQLAERDDVLEEAAE